MADTIAALATAPVRAALGVIRMSGPDAFRIAEECLRYRGENRLIAPDQVRNLSFGRISDGEETVDEAVVSAFRGPHSYTGEDTVEFSCHGGVYLLNRVLTLLFAHGARQAAGGEFTKRAFLNGKTDLTRAEGVMDLIDAEYAGASRAAMRELDGSLAARIRTLQEGLLHPAAALLAYVDYPDDEIEEITAEQFRDQLREVLRKTEVLCGSYRTGRILKDGLRTVLCGKPNVGKSSLMNRFSRSERSIVTPVAGTTRDTVEETAVIGGCKLILTDTAGIRETDDPVERIGVERAKAELARAELILCVFGDEPDEEDRKLAEEARNASGKTLFLFNKSDLCPDRRLPDWAAWADGAFSVSALTGDGLDETEAFLGGFLQDIPSDGVLVTNARQFDCLCRIRTALNRALAADVPPDMMLLDVEEALTAVGELTGERASEQLIGEIFSRFCVGK